MILNGKQVNEKLPRDGSLGLKKRWLFETGIRYSIFLGWFVVADYFCLSDRL